MVKDRLIHYSKVKGPRGETLATFFRFQNQPNSDYPQIYRPYDSLLNHKSRLVRNTKGWLSDFLSLTEIEETQLILVSHDVPELIHGDTSRLSTETEHTKTFGLADLLLPEDILRVHDFEKAQEFLERGNEELPKSPFSIIARILDTIDGNYFAFALLENYALKVGGAKTDPKLQLMLERSYAYVNKMRHRYRDRIAKTGGSYTIDLAEILDKLQKIEKGLIDKFSQSISAEGYEVGSLV